eukprot:gene3507-6976_t
MSKSDRLWNPQDVDKVLQNNDYIKTELKSVPYELCVGERLNLSRWALLLSDDVLDFLSKKAAEKKPHFFIDSSQLTLKKMFGPNFWNEAVADQGLLGLNIAGAKHITDHGISKISQRCSTIKNFDLSGCSDITDASLREIGLYCRNLQILSISSCNHIEGAGLVTIAECCSKLIKLNISRCRNLQRYAVSKIFTECKKLEDVNISNLQCISDEEIRILSQNCPRLMSLNAADTSLISDTGILALSQHCPDLDLLDLTRREMTYKVTDVGMLALGQRSSSLRVLRLSGCDYITDVGLSWLAQGCKALEELDFSGCTKISDAGLRSIGDACHSLTSIDVSRAKLVSDIGITSISAGCPNLLRMNCSGLYFLADPRCTPHRKKGEPKLDTTQSSIGITAVSKYCRSLESLDVSGCFRLNIALQKHVARRLNALKRLNLTGCNQITIETLAAIGTGCTKLEELILADCGTSVCATSILAFSKNCPEMKSLVLARCDSIKASSIRAISNFSKLEKLDVTGCKSLDDESILPLCEVDRVTALKHLSLVDCHLITDTGLAWLSNGCKKLQLVALKGTAITRHASQALRECFPYSDMVFNQNFIGFWPKSSVEDRIMMHAYGRMNGSLVTLQGKIRCMIAKKCVKEKTHTKYINIAASMIQKLIYKVKGKHILQRKRYEVQVSNVASTKLTAFFRIIVAKQTVTRLRAMKLFELKTRCAILIQTTLRKYFEYKKMVIQRERYKMYLQYRDASAITMQALARMFFSRKRVKIMRNHRDATNNLRQRKASLIQRVYRGHLDREHVRRLREHLEYEFSVKSAAAMTIQLAWRRYQAHLDVINMRNHKLKREHAAIIIQSGIRGRLARWDLQSRLTEMRFETRLWAATRLQSRWRSKQAQLLKERLAKQAFELDMKRRASAYIIVRQMHVFLSRLELNRRRKAHFEDLRKKVILEMNAATTIQSAYRGMKGRILFKEKLKYRKGQWKELFDEEQKKRFFYNKLTGEIRWRMPQDLLDLIPRPICDNCNFYEGTTECETCHEVFCGECWNQVHFGGRRKDHKFRAIYDYYDKRIDYGDNEFPGKWPTEMMQDEVQGWMLRVAPMREPMEILNEWEHYQELEAVVDDTGNPTVLKDFFFNRITFESCYEAPIAFVTAQQEALALASSTYSTTQDDMSSSMGYNTMGSYQYFSESGRGYNSSRYKYNDDNNQSYDDASYNAISSQRYTPGETARSIGRSMSSRNR